MPFIGSHFIFNSFTPNFFQLLFDCTIPVTFRWCYTQNVWWSAMDVRVTHEVSVLISQLFQTMFQHPFQWLSVWLCAVACILLRWSLVYLWMNVGSLNTAGADQWSGSSIAKSKSHCLFICIVLLIGAYVACVCIVWFIYCFWDKTSMLRLLSVPGHG